MTYVETFKLHSLFAEKNLSFIEDPFIQVAPYELSTMYMNYRSGFYFPPIYLK